MGMRSPSDGEGKRVVFVHDEPLYEMDIEPRAQPWVLTYAPWPPPKATATIVAEPDDWLPASALRPRKRKLVQRIPGHAGRPRPDFTVIVVLAWFAAVPVVLISTLWLLVLLVILIHGRGD